MNDRLRALSDEGVAIWIDDVSRARLSSGNLAELVTDKHIVGVTSNPTIFAKALSDADGYADQVRDLAVRGVGVEESVRAITTYDIRWACDVLRPVYEASEGVDGRVSIEVDPRLARETAKTIAEARALWWMVDRPNLFIKIPATQEGLPAITAALAEGISVNVTLIFSLDRYSEVMAAFLTGLEQAELAGHDLSTIASVASFFVSRVDSEVDRRLEAVGAGEALGLRGRAAVAQAKLAYRLFREQFSGPRWERLATLGAHRQCPLWASTSTKDPAYPDTLYVDSLIGPDTVSTLPEATIADYEDRGTLARTIDTGVEDADETMRRLPTLGIDMADVGLTLETQGVASFHASFQEVLAALEAKAGHLVGR